MANIIDARTGRASAKWKAQDSTGVRIAAFSPDGLWLATSGFQSGTHLSDYEAMVGRSSPQPCAGHRNVVLTVIITPGSAPRRAGGEGTNSNCQPLRSAAARRADLAEPM